MKKEKLVQVSIFTDGSHRPALNTGAWACHIAWYSRGRFRVVELVKSVSGAMNAMEMELLAIVKSLDALDRPCRVTLYTDQSFLVTAMQKRNTWANGSAETWPRWARLNRNLVERLIRYTEVHDLTFHWIRSHSGSNANRRCDRLAAKSALALEKRLLQTKKQSAEPVHLSAGMLLPADGMPVWAL